MGKRKAISKKVRFEVFKRDSFSCQYCGASSPEVVLEVDHIHPVSKGGDNEILNLITSCRACNSGKSNRTIDDNSILQKQKEQLAELSEKRNQMEMMIEWREGLKSIDSDLIARLLKEINDHLAVCELNENGKKIVSKWIKKHPYQLLSECIDISSGQYLRFDADDNLVDGCVDKFLSMIPRIAANKTANGDDDEVGRLYYARGILRNRLDYINEHKCIEILKEAYKHGATTVELISITKSTDSWSDFKLCIDDLLEELIHG